MRRPPSDRALPPSQHPPRVSEGVPARRRLAAWCFLLLTLASGVFLRYQWTGQTAPWFDSRFLLHAHSHVALLGWTFVAVFALVFASAGRVGARPGSVEQSSRAAPTAVLRLLGEGLVFSLILALFVAFLFEGYAFWSILLSTLHIGVAFGLIAGYVAGARTAIDRNARPWIDASMVWFVLANLGPLLLSGGGRMGQGWIDAWVGYYLTLAFNGWLTFAVIGLLVGAGWLRAGSTIFRVMALGVLPTALPPLTAWIEIPLARSVGWMGAILFGGALVVLGWGGLRDLLSGLAGGVSEASGPARGLLGSVAVALLLLGVLGMIGSAPPLAPEVAGTRMLMIGFIHLQLMGFVSSGLILLLFPRLRGMAIWPFLVGSWMMILILIGAGAMQFFGHRVRTPLQGILAGAGLIALAGAFFLPRVGRPRVGSKG